MIHRIINWKLASLLFLTSIFFFNFVSRMIFAPLLPTIEHDLGISHGAAGRFFIMISIGYSLGLGSSGFISSRLSHRLTITISSLIIGVTLISVSFSRSLWEMYVSLIFLGTAAGIYLPSAIATITNLINFKNWGKAIGVHELAPSLAFIAAPLITEALLPFFSWRTILIIIGVTSISIALVFIFFGRGGNLRGESPNYDNLKSIFSRPVFWVMTLFFSLAIAASIGVYSMLPLYLVSERGIERNIANTFIAFSRIAVLFITIGAGWISDRFGSTRTIRSVLFFNGLMTILLGAVPGRWIFPCVFLQPLLSVCFFPAGFTILSRLVEPHLRNICISMTIFIAYFIGAGVIPAVMGILGDIGQFALSIMIVGSLIMASTFLVRFITPSLEK